MRQSLFILAFALTACGQNRGDPDICVVPPTALQSAAETGDFKWARRTEGCIGRWAQRVAKAPGSIDEVAAAAIGGCLDAIENQADEWRALQARERQPQDDYRATIRRYEERATKLARFHVAVARAGNCKTP